MNLTDCLVLGPLAPVSRFQFPSPYCPSEESLAELALLMAVSKAGNSCDTVNRV